jgi:hypothetical protein
MGPLWIALCAFADASSAREIPAVCLEVDDGIHVYKLVYAPGAHKGVVAYFDTWSQSWEHVNEVDLSVVRQALVRFRLKGPLRIFARKDASVFSRRTSGGPEAIDSKLQEIMSKRRLGHSSRKDQAGPPERRHDEALARKAIEFISDQIDW